MLQFGLRAHDFGTLPAELLADTLAPFHPSSIQLALSKAVSGSPTAAGFMSPGYARRLRDIFAEREIAVSVLGCYINPVHPDPNERNRGLLRFEEHLRYARDFGCSIVGTETGSRGADCTFHPDTEKKETFDLLCLSLERLIRTAERCASIIGVEAVAGTHTVSSIEKMQELLRRLDSPNLQVIYDPVNLIPLTGFSESQEAFFARAFASLGQKIAAVHVKDFRMESGIKKGTLASGTGDLDYASLFRHLQICKPNIDVILENTLPSNAADALAFVRRLARETTDEKPV